MNTSQEIDDPTCLIKLLDEFRSHNPRHSNLLENVPAPLVPTRLQFNDSLNITTVTPSDKKRLLLDETNLTSQKKKKSYDSPIRLTPCTSSQHNSSELSASPWEIRKLKADLIQAKTLNAELQNELKKMESLKKETEVHYENVKRRLQKQEQWDKETIKSLEDRIATFRKREQERMEELSQSRQSVENNKYHFEKKMLALEVENTQLKNQIKELELKHYSSSGDDRRVSKLEAELTLFTEEISAYKVNIESLEEKAVERVHLKHQIEVTEQQLAEAKRKIRELENYIEDEKEMREQIEKQHEKLKQFPELEKKVATLREEIKNLRDAVHNKLILEEEVMDLRARQAGFEEREWQLSQLKTAKEHLESMLEKWHNLARDHCEGVPPERAISGPELLRIRIETLQQKELLFTSDMANLESKLKSVQRGKDLVDAKLAEASKQLEKLQTIDEQHTNLIKRLQKKVILVSRERDSYRSQLDMYEKDLTVSSTSTVDLQYHQQKSRIEALEKTVEGYRELVEKLEGDQARFPRTSDGNPVLNERIEKLEAERNTLRQEKEELLKRKDELEVELEYRALKGDFNPMKTKVLHMRINPVSEAQNKREDEILKLKQECGRLRERLKLMEEGQREDLTEAVNIKLSACNSQEVEDLRNEVKSKETRIQRLTEAFKTTSQEFRDVCYMLLGFRIDRVKPGLYRLSSMYAESGEDHLIFKVTGGNPELLETPYSLTLQEFINLHLKHQHSIPVFLSAITLDLFNRQTVISIDETTLG